VEVCSSKRWIQRNENTSVIDVGLHKMMTDKFYIQISVRSRVILQNILELFDFRLNNLLSIDQ
jgi:hypothetical protein